eukprot:EG_transcript_63601
MPWISIHMCAFWSDVKNRHKSPVQRLFQNSRFSVRSSTIIICASFSTWVRSSTISFKHQILGILQPGIQNCPSLTFTTHMARRLNVPQEHQWIKEKQNFAKTSAGM